MWLGLEEGLTFSKIEAKTNKLVRFQEKTGELHFQQHWSLGESGMCVTLHSAGTTNPSAT